MRTLILSLIEKALKRYKGSAINMRRRLLFFLLILMFAMLGCVMSLLSVYGVFPFGAGEREKMFLNELSKLSAGVSKQYGVASVHAVRMSERLTANISEFMRRHALSSAELKKRPDLLEPLLVEQLSILKMNLDVTDCSGVFVTLDATVNPSILNSENSKAGLYIRAIEPNISGMGTEIRYLLRGSSSIAGDGLMNLQAKWNLEFDVTEQLFWWEPIKAYNSDPTLPLSRLVFWCSMSPVQGLNEDVMVCSVPLLDNNGELLGVCGFEVSQMNFMLRHEPNIDGFHNAVFLFSSADGNQIKLEDALFSGNNYMYAMFPVQGLISKVDKYGSFTFYVMPGGIFFAGVDKTMQLYPGGSPFAGQTYSTALIIPKADFDAALNKDRIRFGLILFALMAIGVAASVYLSNRYVEPIIDKLVNADESGLSSKTNIVEIDRLIEKINELHEKDRPVPDYLFGDFIARIKTLTFTESEIFRHYVDGKSINEILKIMFISMSTLKTHNRHLYSKLGVTSKDELMLYVELIKKSKLEEKIL
jgi:DNA-binding CsgD family transcriptional regulator